MSWAGSFRVLSCGVGQRWCVLSGCAEMGQGRSTGDTSLHNAEA
jgi:hypothetical protein